MLGRLYRRARWYMLPLIILAIGTIITSSSAFAGVPLTNPTGNGAGVSQQAPNGPAPDFVAGRRALSTKLGQGGGNINSAPLPSPRYTDGRHRTLPPQTEDGFIAMVPDTT